MLKVNTVKMDCRCPCLKRARLIREIAQQQLLKRMQHWCNVNFLLNTNFGKAGMPVYWPEIHPQWRHQIYRWHQSLEQSKGRKPAPPDPPACHSSQGKRTRAIPGNLKWSNIWTVTSVLRFWAFLTLKDDQKHVTRVGSFCDFLLAEKRIYWTLDFSQKSNEQT